jgi:ribosome-binding factor A
MNHKRPSRRQIKSLCAEVHADDGVDPKQFFRPAKTDRKTDRKTLQLCRQVAETLSQVLSGECGDDVLQSLQVVSVQPAPNASQLLVLVSPTVIDSVDAATILTHLEAANGRLRSEVAAAIVRRRAPKLMFQVVAAEGRP